MKKVLVLIISLLVISSISFALELSIDNDTTTYTGPDVSLYLNGALFTPSQGQMPPVIIDGRTLVPVREVFEQLNGKVDWDNESRKAIISMNGNTIILTINSNVALVNDAPTSLDVPAKIINDKTMVPVRFISENCGLLVDWNDETKSVLINIPSTEATEQETSISIVIKQLNSKYEKYFGEKKSKTAAYQLCNLVQTNNLGSSSHQITIRYYGSGITEQTAIANVDIYTLTSNILKTTRSNFNISGGYDEEGYINVVNIEKVDW